MPGPFFQRLRSYYLKVAAVLRGEAESASIFPNPTDVGMARERVYAEFLRLHAPSKCNVFLGGFLFGEDGSESGQLDVIVTTDTTPRFDFHNSDGNGKAFSPVEGTLAVASIKSMLNKNELEDALIGLSKIPPTGSLDRRVTLGMKIHEYDDWPYKIVYASDGILGNTLFGHLQDFYLRNPTIPLARRPNILHVAGKYFIIRASAGLSIFYPKTMQSEKVEAGTFRFFGEESPDLQAIVTVLAKLQGLAAASTHIVYSYTDTMNRVVFSQYDEQIKQATGVFQMHGF